VALGAWARAAGSRAAGSRSGGSRSGGSRSGGPGPGADPPGSEATNDGSTSDGPIPDGPPGPPATVIAVVDHAALVRGYVQGDDCCRIDGLGPVPVSSVTAMMGDAFLAAVVRDGVDIRSVVHLGRTPTALQRSALIVRDPTCVVPGCGQVAHLECDHCPAWAETHHTTLDELARLCRHHHHLKTYQGWTLTGSPGAWQWHPPPPGPFDHDGAPTADLPEDLESFDARPDPDPQEPYDPDPRHHDPRHHDPRHEQTFGPSPTEADPLRLFDAAPPQDERASPEHPARVG
ncbi:MAG: HNH endonuclease signature motif containing protein, partial [Acidimicrobiales bacterium]